MNEGKKELEVGDLVVYCDPKGNDHKALVTAVWTPTCINLVLVSPDSEKQDSYGRQIERQTSMTHVSESEVHGFYWRRPDEEKNPYKAPLAV